MGRPQELSGASSSLLRQAMLRLFLAVMASGLTTVAAGVFIFRAASDAATTRQLNDASEFVERRAAQLDRRWEADAFALKTQIELARLTDDTRLAGPRLTSFFTALGGVGQFSAAVIRDGNGAVVFRFPAALDTAALPPGQSAWLLDKPSRTIYRALQQPLWMGDAGMGWITLLRPLDHALLYETAFPGTHLYIEWQGQILASSLGSSGIAAGQSLVGRGSEQGKISRIAWKSATAGPELLVAPAGQAPFDIGWVLIAGLVGAFVVGVLAWVLLRQWLQTTGQRLQRVEAAINHFHADPALGAGSDAALAVESGDDEISRLAQGTRSMMHGIVEARAQQVRAQAGLAELNASLEQRVDERTRELAAARDAALEASRAKEMFLANMSHELRTPMNGLLGALELLSTMPLSAEQRAMLDTAATSGDALLAVINDVLDFAKINAGKLELVREPVALRELVTGAVTLFSASARGKGLELRLEWDDALPEWVSVDVVRLRQVLLNLLGNAIKFTAHGAVVARARRSDTEDPQVVLFEVADTGIGIAADRLESIFDPFVQADSSPRRGHGGTGLGLAISRRLAEAMGGSIEAESQPGVGSTFRLRIPAPAVAASDRPAAPAEEPFVCARLSGRVLLVEDNIVNRIIAGTVLKRLGLEVIECVDGREACRLVRSEAFDAVLMDVMMPVMDGLSATREIRAREAREGLPRLPIIALTASALRADVEASIVAGMDSHVAKPFSQLQIAQALALHLRVTT